MVDAIENDTEVSPRTTNAWFVCLGKEACLNEFSVSIEQDSSGLITMQEGDGVLVIEEREGVHFAVAFARVFRKRSSLNETTFYFDGLVSIEQSTVLDELGVSPLAMTGTIIRLDWPVFESALKKACGLEFSSFPVLSGDASGEQPYVRELLQHAVIDDLLGPADGPFEEIIGMRVRDRYLVGKLAPQNTVIEEEDDLSTAGDQAGVEETAQETNASTNQSLVPSSLGFTFCVDGKAESVVLYASWGSYESTESERVDENTGRPFQCWRRTPSQGTVVVSLKERTIDPLVIDVHCPGVIIQGSVGAPLQNGDRLVTFFLVNNQTSPEQNVDEAWIFQPKLIVSDPENSPIFRRRPLQDTDGFDDERESLEMIYRRQVEFAVGHGVSVHARTAVGDDQHAVEISTSILPQHEVPITETPGLDDEDRPAMRRMVEEGSLDMERLANLERPELIAVLTSLTEDYTEWIGEQESRATKDVSDFLNAAENAMDQCKQVLERLKKGIEVLESDDKALESFRFTNQVMASQRIHSIYTLLKRRGVDKDIDTLNVPKNRSWYPFQLAFILLSIPSITDPAHPDRTEPLEAYADLLWFPTGGGKTEAYLGVAAFTMAIRRLQDKLGGFDSGRGLGVIMRYTLRLLTLQQFQRATTLICAMEVLRRTDKDKWGTEPFTIGLWVGDKVTPNSTDVSHNAILAIRNRQLPKTGSPAQLTSCPWCGSKIMEGRDIAVNRDIKRTFIFCGDKLGRCDFSRSKSKDLGLPVLVVDEEIYRRPPTMLIATVDKFAMMAWRGQVRTLFGIATQECERHGLLWPGSDCKGDHQKKGSLSSTSVKLITQIRPPDLIIQDEFHLISGPLGTMVGLYETAVDELSTWNIDDKAIRPKIIASTATVRKASEQMNNVFLRKVAVFPPHGLDIDDNFFSVQRSIDKKPGRRYMGICSPGSSRPAVLIRVYVALLTASQSLFERFGQLADPYMTIVGYFNSLRELGGMKRLSEDDVQTRAYRVQMSNIARPGLSQRSISNVDELTSRVLSKDIPGKLDRLEVKFKSTWEKGETRAIDIELATNMFSVGVDVNRLGLMVMNGQPKNTAEYIQATSRIGRFFPGLVCTVLTWSRPRDLSHYETFEHYHATFYKHVEAQSVTPFSPRALDRGLTGIMVSMLRLNNEHLCPNLGAHALINTSNPEVDDVRHSIADRTWKVSNKLVKQNAETMILDRIDYWVKEAGRPGRRLGYETERRQGDVAPLLKKPGAIAWEKFTVPTSMREVEPGVKLIMDVSNLSDNHPAWQARRNDNEEEGEE